MNIKYPFLFALILWTFGCASTPIATNISTVAEDPYQFRNKRIEITAPVIQNTAPRGDEYRTWTSIIGSSESYQIMLSEEGFNPATIEKAYLLVEEARKKGDPITVTGRLRVGPYQDIESGLEIEVDSIQYKNVRIGTDRGPFVREYYYHPYYYHGPILWPYRYHHHHYWW